MIKNEYIEEIIDTSCKEKIISKGLINRIALSLVEELDPLTKSKFQEFSFAENLWNNPTVYASCDKNEGIIYYCYEHALQSAIILLNEKNTHLYSNFTILQYLIHELEHLKEDYKKQQNETERKLIINSSHELVIEMLIDKYFPNVLKKYKDKIVLQNLLFHMYQKFYLPIWNICPDEKIADSDAYKIIVDSINNYPNFKNDFKEDYDDIIISYISSLLTGYRKNNYTQKFNIPLQKYIEKIKKIDICSKMDYTMKDIINNSDCYSEEEKMKYGLPIVSEDISKVKSKYLQKNT